MTRVLVIGAGIAGLAAAWGARRRGFDVTLVSRGAGASALSGGAVDDVPWERLLRATRLLREDAPGSSITPEIQAFSDDLGLWDLPTSSPVWLATIAGRVRPARGRDRALLDLASLPRPLVLLPRADRAAWDADAIAHALSEDPVSKARKLVFRAVDAAVLRFDEERRISDGDLAMRHDDEARRGWLVDRLRAVLEREPEAGAVLMGPWLGAAAPRAEAISRALSLPVGEALAGAGSPAGLRFEAARDAMLSSMGIHRKRGRVTALRLVERGIEADIDGDTTPVKASFAVLATGGLVGGGVVYAPPEHSAGADLPPQGRIPFSLSLDAPVALSFGGTGRMEIVASMHGPELDTSAWPDAGKPGALETVGIRCEVSRAAESIFAAGDVVAGRARTLLEAVAAGIAAVDR